MICADGFCSDGRFAISPNFAGVGDLSSDVFYILDVSMVIRFFPH